MDEAKQADQSSLTGRFALFGGVIVIGVCLAIGFFAHQSVRRDLQVLAESNNVALTRAFANLVWPRYADFVGSAGNLSVDDLRRHDRTHALRAEVLSAMRGLSVLKVKIYNLEGLTAFSTDPTQIGDDKSGNTGFLAAKFGKVASELTHRDTFSAFEQTIEDRDVLSSYIPISNSFGEIEGVFEIYYDVTRLLQETENSQVLEIAVVAGAMAVLYVALVLVVWYSEQRRKRQQEENLRLVRAAAVAEEASRMKSEFMAHMSHELRTPLNAILGLSEVVKTQLFGPIGSTRYLDYAKDIWASGQHLLAIVDDVLDMAKAEAGQITLEETEFEVPKMLAACLGEYTARSDEANVRLALDAPKTLPYLRADRRRVKQIVLNLLSNAVEFTPAGGTVTMEAIETPSGGLRISIADTGLGIAEEDIPKVLVPFSRAGGPYSANVGGVGLGLSIAKALAAMHDATLEINSRVKTGTRVTVEFPPERLRRDLGDHIAEAIQLTAS